MDGVNTKLDAEALKALQDARNAVTQLRNAGIPVNVDEPTQKKEIPASKVRVSERETEVSVPNYENFMLIENLPSKGLFYKNKLKGQALKMEDILQIQTMNEYNIHSNFTEIYSRRLRGVSPDDILAADEMYIALWLRASSFPNSNHPSVGFTCKNKKCKFKMVDPAYEVAFSQITYDVDPSPSTLFELYNGNDFVEDVIQCTSKPVKIQLRRRYHDTIINELLDTDFYSKDKLPSEYYVNLLRIAVVVQIGNANDIYDRINAIKNLNPEESYELIKLISKYSLSAEPVVNHRCPKCGEVTSIKGYPFRIEEYLPPNYGNSSTGDEISNKQ